MKFTIAVVFSILLLTFITSTLAFQKDSFKASTVSCDLCEFTVGGAEYLIKNLSLSQQEVDAELQKICTIVPANMTKECKFFMLFTGPLITSALIKGENPETLCTTYKFCAPETPSPTPTKAALQSLIGNDNHDLKPHANKNNNNNHHKDLKIKLNH
ncbi:hypothetical protein DICPUDRAFT_51110 [Dictyostelium purpureum]|uniref:Saposin B-type domain-containing protein n=1 Tax=Dictyostelium purpureum TaxID=5786 RepID=F1A241_DICPU|nr:uncharacterized protein DICPUDRAFT_51110 [Dictyostelium purpureum]EGC29744.1 hypothetical protein DICPUDRAFT_51110 [Dictyostelium purpureum]|eukprot:XP_003293737.1 hypothetical protein DICPUDRAFT_51110 [Dictyostelium purpureum]